MVVTISGSVEYFGLPPGRPRLRTSNLTCTPDVFLFPIHSELNVYYFIFRANHLHTWTITMTQTMRSQVESTQ